jgi:hypothetical protein
MGCSQPTHFRTEAHFTLPQSQPPTAGCRSHPTGSVFTNGDQRELCACRPDGAGGFEVIQLTDFFGDYEFYDSTAGMAHWSNDGVDSFISLTAWDYTDAYSPDPDDETTEILDLRKRRKCIIRLPVSALELTAAADAGLVVPLTSDDCELVFSTATTYARTCQHSWSPDGTKVAYIQNSPDQTAGDDLWVLDITSGTTTLVWDVSTTSTIPYSPLWQPQGSRILVQYDDFISYVVNADGTGGGPTPSGSDNAWSPDGKHTIYWQHDQVRIKGVNYDRLNIYRYEWQTGATVKLTNDLAYEDFEGLLHWVSDTTASP